MLTFSHKHINKHIYMENSSHRTSTEHWQKNLPLQKGQETLDITGKKREREREGIRMGLALLKGSCEGEKEPTSWEAT